jgi:tRNA dimethylallyltransferase
VPSARDSRPLIAVVGLTASGKSDWAMQIACRLKGEIVSIDSRQIYRRLDIGTAKPDRQMLAEIPHWCIDIVDPTERCSLGEYLKTARAAIADIQTRGRQPIVVGGSGQHMRALLQGWVIPPVEEDSELRRSLESQPTPNLVELLREVDPQAAERIGPTNVRRIVRALEVHELTGIPISEWQQRRLPVAARSFAPDIALSELDKRIEQRTKSMFADGFVEEVHALLLDGVPEDAPGFDAIGYREVLAHLRGDSTREEAQAAVAQATRRLARRQQAWFRRDDPAICWAADVPLEMLG